MNRILKYICAVAAVALAFGCGQKDSQEQKALSPEETVQAFYKAVSCGDFEAAAELCDTVSMKDYLNTHRGSWERIVQTDSTVASIAGSLLSSAAISIADIARDGDRRQIRYSIDAAMGMKKDKIATVKKDNGVWKVERITDAL